MLKYFIFVFILHLSRGEKFIINTDAGADDGVAILSLFRHEAANQHSGFEIIGITCSFGNIDERQGEKNILNTLYVANRSKYGLKRIPVYRGAEKGFINPYHTDYFFGQDGFGNSHFTDDNLPDAIDRSKHAAVALVDMVKEHSGNVSIISLGPTTNLALAIALDKDFMTHVKYVHQMGGSVEGRGNNFPNVEFNFAADPESNYMLFNAAGDGQIVLYPWENTLDAVVTKDWRMNVLGKYDSPYVKFINKIEKIILDNEKEQNWISADTLAVASIIEPSIVLKQEKLNVYPVMDGAARGSVLVDYSHLTNRLKNTVVVQKLNVSMYKQLMIRLLTCEEIGC